MVSHMIKTNREEVFKHVFQHIQKLCRDQTLQFITDQGRVRDSQANVQGYDLLICQESIGVVILRQNSSLFVSLFFFYVYTEQPKHMPCKQNVTGFQHEWTKRWLISFNGH